ncbi:MAG: nitronate monooxygenase family protein, partial [Myxococcota bacterium]|nr:nitronate monooxygenase family protein [Myxococcota bacterium]
DFDKTTLEDMVPRRHRAFIEELLARHGVPELPEGVDSTETLLGWSASKGMAHVEVALDHPIALIANALGPPPPEAIEAAHAKGVAIAALCGSVKQAKKQAEAGVDIVIASGYEAGGHTGEIASMVLIPQVVDAVAPTPVLAAGGIGGGRQMAAAMALGAQGVWTGSLWLTTAESDCPPALVDKLIEASSEQTIRSRCISGKPARQLVTTYTDAWEGEASPGTLPMPLQWMATAEATQRIYRHARGGEPGSAELLGTPVGQVVGQMDAVRSVSSVMNEMVHEYIDVVTGAATALESEGAD